MPQAQHIDNDADTGLRDSIESSVATHTDSPDVESISNGARELRDQELRKSEKSPVDIRDRLRKNIRDAVMETKSKAASPAKKKGDGFEVPPGPPVSWDQNAKAAWSEMPHEARMAALREQKSFADAVTPIAQKYSEIEQTLAPFRQHYAPHGLSDKQAIGNALGWARELQGPNKHQAMLGLMQQTGIGLQELVAMAYGQPAPAAHEQSLGRLAQDQQAQQEHQARQEIAEFSRGKPNFQALAPTMGHLMMSTLQTTGREMTLQEAYDTVSGAAGGGGSSSSSKRRAAVSPKGGSPAGKVERDGGKRSSGIRNSIVSAFREARGMD